MTMRRVGVALTMMALIGAAGCNRGAKPLVQSRDAVASVHTFGRTSITVTPKKAGELRLRVSCISKGILDVAVTGAGGQGTAQIACPGNLEMGGFAATPKQQITLRVTGDGKNVDGWAELVPVKG